MDYVYGPRNPTYNFVPQGAYDYGAPAGPGITNQVTDCRRILKWSYAYGYFATFDATRKDYFEYQQGSLEQKVDQLQELSEKTDLRALSEDPSRQKFLEFKSELINLTKIVANFFTNLC